MMVIKKQVLGSVDIGPRKLKSLSHNPFFGEIDCSSLVAVDADIIMGRVDVVPLQISAYDKTFKVCGGSALSVEPRYRGKGIAAKLTLERLNLSRDGIAIASGLSGMSLPLFKKLDFVTFTFPRMILLKKSRSVLEMKLRGSLLHFTSTCVDWLLRLFISLKRHFSIWNDKTIKIEEISKPNEDIIKIIDKDPHPFKENHTKEWFEWVLHYPFDENVSARQHLFQVIIRGKVEGFFMTKERFHEQASRRGFKNIILGSVIEWGVNPNCIITEQQICKAAVLSFGKHIDAVEICSSDKKMVNSLRKWGLLSVGDSNFAIKALDNSTFSAYYKEYSDINNWRIRPAMSDNGLS